MSENKIIGVISRVQLGFGGYQEGMFGLGLTFDFKGSGCQTFISGGWTFEPTPQAAWTREDQERNRADLCEKIIKTMKDAKVDNLEKLVGKPVECVFDGPVGELKSWRILTEAIL